MIYQGDCLDILPILEPKSVQCCVTSPPYYGLRDYGTAEWVGGNKDCNHKQGTARNDGGRVNTSGFHGSSKADSDKGAMNYKTICGKCGAVRTDKQIGLEETPEAYVEKLVAVFREVRRVLKDDGTLWLNLGDSYNGSGGAGGDYNDGGLKEGQPKYPGRNIHALKPKDLIGIPWRVAFALQADGWYLRQDIIWAKPNPMPESVTDRCTKSHEYIFLLTKSARYYYDNEAIGSEILDDTSKRYKSGWNGNGDRGFPSGPQNHIHNFMDPNNNKRQWANKKSVWSITTQPYKEAHFATFPEEIPRTCILAGSKKGDTILDPFSGAGTTGVVAEKLNRKYIGIELNPQYTKMAEDRIYNVQPLFAGLEL